MIGMGNTGLSTDRLELRFSETYSGSQGLSHIDLIVLRVRGHVATMQQRKQLLTIYSDKSVDALSMSNH